MSTSPPAPIARWHDLMARRDPQGLDALLAEDCVFVSPAMHTPQVGRAASARYLRAAMGVLGTPGFRYTEEWFGERSAVLEFAVELDGVEINGVDLIHWNERGEIVRFKVMVRPLKGLTALLERMGRALQAG